jgi:hypothetical protein
MMEYRGNAVIHGKARIQRDGGNIEGRQEYRGKARKYCREKAGIQRQAVIKREGDNTERRW